MAIVLPKVVEYRNRILSNNPVSHFRLSPMPPAKAPVRLMSGLDLEQTGVMLAKQQRWRRPFRPSLCFRRLSFGYQRLDGDCSKLCAQLPRYIISDRPMTEEEWIGSGVGIEHLLCSLRSLQVPTDARFWHPE